MISISYKIKFAILGALIVPCCGRIALHGTNFEYDLYRYLVPFIVGGLSGYFIGLMKDRWLATNQNFIKTNKTRKQEIKEHILSRQALQESEDKSKKYLEAIDSMGVGIFVVDSDYHIHYMNKTMIKWFGDHTGSNCHQSVVGLDSPCTYCKLRPVIESNKIVHYTPATPDGRFFDIMCYPIQNSDGSISKMEIIRDITKHKQAEKKIARIAQEWQKTFDATNDAIWLLDKNQRILRSNKKADQLFQRSGMNMIGKYCWEIAHGTKKPISECPNLRARLSLKRETMELKIGEGWFQVNVDPILDTQGQYAGVVHIITDITNLKEAQKIKLQASRMESISTLTGGIAHDFNNLLSIIMGNIELAEMEMSPNNEGLNCLNAAMKASMQASELTRQLITFSKGGAPIKKAGSITDLLKEVANTVLVDTNVACKFELSTELWPLEFDKNQMIHAINNLIDNAVESMPDGGIIIVKAENYIVTAKQRLPINKGKYIKISIRDHGIGIAKEHLSLVFDPYFSTKKMGSQKGTGLGLTTTYSIITRHDGYITVESDQGIGSCFTIYLSAYEKAADVIEHQQISKPEKKLVRTEKILLMDDEEMMRDLGEQMLNTLGYDALLAKNGSEAIRLYKTAMDAGKPFDAIILDLTIKNAMGGKETIKKIMKIDPYVKSIVSSGYSNDPVMTDHRKYGFIGILPKPYNVEKLSEELNKITKE